MTAGEWAAAVVVGLVTGVEVCLFYVWRRLLKIEEDMRGLTNQLSQRPDQDD